MKLSFPNSYTQQHRASIQPPQSSNQAVNKPQSYKPSKKLSSNSKSPISASQTCNKSALNLNSYNQFTHHALSQNPTPDNHHNKSQHAKQQQCFKQSFIDGKCQQFNGNFTQSRKSFDIHQQKQTQQHQSKSTKVSPQRYSMQPVTQEQINNQCNQVMNYIQHIQKQNTARIEGIQQNHSQFNLRIPQNQLIMEQPLISHSHGYNPLKKKVDTGLTTGCDETSLENQTIMQQSFINMIYPSKSKKIINNDSIQQNHQSQKHANKTAVHHHKSKSMLLGVGSDHSLNHDTGIQKIQQCQYKKQSQVFNYSKRLKQILKDTSEEQHDQSKKHHIFSQQPSPISKKSSLMISQTIDFTQSIQNKSQKIAQQKNTISKSTFDKELKTTNNEYAIVFEGQNNIPPQTSYTIDQTYRQNNQKAHTSSNTPSHSQMNQEYIYKVLASKTHVRKPSHPIKNNFIIEVVQHPPNGEQFRLKSRENSVELVEKTKQIPLREKKQHQPTQSKIVQHKIHTIVPSSASTSSGERTHHQRSQSDFTNQYQAHKLQRYLNGTNNAEFVQLDQMVMSQDADMSNNHTPKATGSSIEKTNTFLKQYSQVMMEAVKHQESKVSLYPKKENKDISQHHLFEQTQVQSTAKIDSKTNMHHQRKLSFQPLTQVLHAKKSPQKSSYIYKENSKKLQQSRKTSPKPVLLSQNSNQQKQNKPNKINHSSFSQKTSNITSPANGTSSQNKSSFQISQQTNYKINNLNKPQHCSSAATLQLTHHRSKSDITIVKKQSDVQQQPMFIKPNDNGVSINSEKVTPSKQQLYQNYVNFQQTQRQNAKVVNVQIDLFKGSHPINQCNIVQKSQIQRSSSKPIMNNSNSTNQLSNSNSFIKRKDSFIQSQSKVISPENVSKQIPKNQDGFSLQNSPHKTLYQKQSQQAMHLKSQTNMILSPQLKNNSFGQINQTISQRHHIIDISNDEPSFQILQKSQGQAKQPKTVNNRYLQELSQSTNNNESLTETEQILEQIRSKNIKGSHHLNEVYNFDVHHQFNQNLEDQVQKQQQLFRITEVSIDQNILDSNFDILKQQNKQANVLLNNTFDSSLSYLPTDPNMSPPSKDVFKLKKLIKFNFKKYNEPPTTTSEFYRIGRVLGKGAFGKVNLAAHKLSVQLVAIKSISKEFLKNEDDQKKKIMQEVGILKQSNHPSIVRLFDSFETNKHICFVMELCSGGDLLSYVRKRRKLKEDVAKYFFKQIIEGLAYIHHSKLIAHRDIKLDNILLDAHGKIKICDFGVSKQVSSENERMTEQCGTPAYIAPEILKDKGYEGFKVDVWSAGVCLYAMLIGTVPFKAASMHELHHMIISGKYDLKDEKLSDPAKDLLSKLLQVDPKKRLSAYEVLGHPWLKEAEESMDIFTQKEKDLIKKEYLSKNMDRLNRNCQFNNNTGIQATNQDTEPILTEHNLDTNTNAGSFLQNASTKSIILAPFNSTLSGFEEDECKSFQWPEEIKKMIVKNKVIKFGPKCRDHDRQYENNNNADLDNGVYNNFINEQEKEEAEGSDSSSSNDSLKKSFKETELSSDDEKAEKQIEEAHETKLRQQSELLEFEKQIKMKYVKYQEPVHQIDQDVIYQVAMIGVYPKEYLFRALNNKEMNYATASYYLLLKKQNLIKLMNEDGFENGQNELKF